LSRQARTQGLLQPLVEQTIRGPNWAMLTHRDSENSAMARSFSEWLLGNLD
jgi:LysR family glycine cleavage system transcriptional activator